MPVIALTILILIFVFLIGFYFGRYYECAPTYEERND